MVLVEVILVVDSGGSSTTFCSFGSNSKIVVVAVAVVDRGR